MLKKVLVITLLSFLTPLFSQPSLGRLASLTSNGIYDLMKSPNPVLATVEFRNASFLSDFEAQTFYQLLSMELEKQENRIEYRDLLVDFSGGNGRFNFSDLSGIRYGLYLVLLDTPEGIGASASVRLLDSSRLLGLIYKTVPIEVNEHWAQSSVNSGGVSAALILKMLQRFRLDNSVFYVKQDIESSGQNELYALSPDHLVIWQGTLPDQGLGKKIPINWTFPKTPSVQNEGRLTFLKVDTNRYIAISANFAPQSLIMQITGLGLEQYSAYPFVPLLSATLGNERYLLGSRFVPGANYYDGKIQLLNITSGLPLLSESTKLAQRYIEPFFDLAVIYRDQGLLNSFFMVGESYRLSMLDAEWVPLLMPTPSYATGANLITIANKWFLTSGVDELGDSLNLYDAADGGLRFIGSMSLEGKIHSISEGILEGQAGVWLLRFTVDHNGAKTKWLEFWRVSNEEK